MEIATAPVSDTPGSLLSRSAVLVYGVVAYLTGVAGLVCLILALAQLVPFGFLGSLTLTNALLTNILLVALWGGIHSGMAREGFKRLLTRVIPEPAERPTYVLTSGITSILLIGLWQPLSGTVWSVSSEPVSIFLWGVFIFGWAYMAVATFGINHFDLFGLRQVYLNFKNQPREPLEFATRALYRVTRHPIQAGVLIGVWATPVMTSTQLVLSIGFTLYIFVGLWFEEKDMVRQIGSRYVQYKKETGMFLPRIFKR